MAAHQRTLDKTKDVIRKQLHQDCSNTTGSFPTATSSAYPSVNGAQESSSEYCGDFPAEGQQQQQQQQKWHPYQVIGLSSYNEPLI